MSNAEGSPNDQNLFVPVNITPRSSRSFAPPNPGEDEVQLPKPIIVSARFLIFEICHSFDIRHSDFVIG
jgi:hypothetical protein